VHRLSAPEHVNIGKELISREMIAYAILKKAAANAHHAGKRLDDRRHTIVQVCNEILGGQQQDMLPLHVWMTGRGMHERNRGDLQPLLPEGGNTGWEQDAGHPNDHVNMAQSSNDPQQLDEEKEKIDGNASPLRESF